MPDNDTIIIEDKKTSVKQHYNITEYVNDTDARPLKRLLGYVLPYKKRLAILFALIFCRYTWTAEVTIRCFDSKLLYNCGT